MATRFYLRSTTASPTPTAGEKSTALPVGTADGNSGTGFEDLSLSVSKGAAQTSVGRNTLAQTTDQDNYLARFSSPALAAQTFTAQTWTLAVAVDEGNTQANSFTICSVYVWRPSTNSVVGFIYDSHTSLGIEWGSPEDGLVVTFAGAAVTAQAADILVLEFWRHAIQGMATQYIQTLYYNGATDVTDTTTTDAASYLETPDTIAMQGQSVTANRISNVPTVYSPANIAQEVTAQFITNPTTVRPPTRIDQNVTTQLITNTPTVYAPIVRPDQFVNTNRVASGTQVYSPQQIDQNVTAQFITNPTTVRPPTRIDQNVTTNRVPSSVQVYSPSQIAQNVTAQRITNTPTVYAPASIAQQVVANRVGPTTIVRSPNVQLEPKHFVPPLIVTVASSVTDVLLTTSSVTEAALTTDGKTALTTATDGKTSYSINNDGKTAIDLASDGVTTLEIS